jgi:hypothetical protein
MRRRIIMDNDRYERGAEKFEEIKGEEASEHLKELDPNLAQYVKNFHIVRCTVVYNAVPDFPAGKI